MNDKRTHVFSHTPFSHLLQFLRNNKNKLANCPLCQIKLSTYKQTYQHIYSSHPEYAPRKKIKQRTDSIFNEHVDDIGEHDEHMSNYNVDQLSKQQFDYLASSIDNDDFEILLEDSNIIKSKNKFPVINNVTKVKDNLFFQVLKSIFV